MNVYQSEARTNANAFYQEGYDAADTTLSVCGVRKCPYKKHTFAYSEWWRGLFDQTSIWVIGLRDNYV